MLLKTQSVELQYKCSRELNGGRMWGIGWYGRWNGGYGTGVGAGRLRGNMEMGVQSALVVGCTIQSF